MSRAGRLQDVFWAILDGYEMGDGSFVPGPLHDLPLEQFNEIFDRLIDAAWTTLCPPRDDTPL